jgi:hypothetical protein
MSRQLLPLSVLTVISLVAMPVRTVFVYTIDVRTADLLLSDVINAILDVIIILLMNIEVYAGCTSDQANPPWPEPTPLRSRPTAAYTTAWCVGWASGLDDA